MTEDQKTILLADQRDTEIADLVQTMRDALVILQDTSVESVEDRIGNAILTLEIALRNHRPYQPLKK